MAKKSTHEYPQKHPAQELCIKSVLVDEEIIPIVKFLNQFANIRTQRSCQGEDHVNYPGYVTFFAEDMESLSVLLRELDGTKFKIVGVDHYSDLLPFRFHLRFNTKEEIRQFIEWIELNKESEPESQETPDSETKEDGA